MDKISSIVALRISVFFSTSNNVLSRIRVCDKEKFVNSSDLQSILFRLLRWVNLLSLNIGQWRRKCEVDSISKPQLEIRLKLF